METKGLLFDLAEIISSNNELCNLAKSNLTNLRLHHTYTYAKLYLRQHVFVRTRYVFQDLLYSYE
jgi:hypothetical protein